MRGELEPVQAFFSFNPDGSLVFGQIDPKLIGNQQFPALKIRLLSEEVNIAADRLRASLAGFPSGELNSEVVNAAVDLLSSMNRYNAEVLEGLHRLAEMARNRELDV